MTWTQTIERYLAEGRTVSGGKGADTANSQRTQELDMQKQAFDAQMKRMDQVLKIVSPDLGGKSGYDPKLMASMRSNFLNTNSRSFNDAGRQVRAALGARGSGLGNQPVGGDYVRGISGLMGAQASDKSQGLMGLDMQNAMQALNNRWNAVNAINGQSATLVGTQGVAGAGASSALGDYMRGANSGFGQSFMGALGSGLGGGVSAFGTGGFGSLGSSLGKMMRG